MKFHARRFQKRQASHQAWTMWAFLVSLAFVSGCKSGAPAANPLDGEWMLRMEMADRSGEAPSVDWGILVLNRELPRYPDDPQLSDSTIVGRAYIDLAPGPDASGARFLEGPGADRIETVHVFVRGDRVVIHLAPHLKDASPILIGRMTQNGITGTWKSTIENAPPVHGSFTMRRARTRHYTDSAATRARRGLQEWDAS
jgi:hypothetical protein